MILRSGRGRGAAPRAPAPANTRYHVSFRRQEAIKIIYSRRCCTGSASFCHPRDRRRFVIQGIGVVLSSKGHRIHAQHRCGRRRLLPWAVLARDAQKDCLNLRATLTNLREAILQLFGLF